MMVHSLCAENLTDRMRDVSSSFNTKRVAPHCTRIKVVTPFQDQGHVSNDRSITLYIYACLCAMQAVGNNSAFFNRNDERNDNANQLIL